MAITKKKGDFGEQMVIAEVMRRGMKVALPIGEDWPFDVIVLRNGKLERVQCKYTESDGEVVEVKCRSTNGWIDHRYTAKDLDWLAAYDKTTDKCFFIPAALLGEGGRTSISLRLSPPKNGQRKGILMASDFLKF